MPEIVFATLDDSFSKTEPDEEIQDLLQASVGLNLGVHYLSGSITYDPIVKKIEPTIASKIVLLDYILTNVDRTPRNTNMLMWHKELWLIDHGASLYFHHSWENLEEQSKRAFVGIKDHVLLAQASEIEAVVEEFCATLTPQLIHEIVNLIPDEWLSDSSVLDSPDERRRIYTQFIETRVKMIDSVIKEIENARKSTI
jgi:hypothetical protein